MAKVEINGREIYLLYDMGAMELGCTEFGGMDELNAAIRHEAGRNVISDMLRLICVMGNNALEADGKPMDLTVSWLRHNIAMMRMGDIAKAVNEAIAEGVKRELATQKNPDEPVDGWLEEEKKA